MARLYDRFVKHSSNPVAAIFGTRWSTIAGQSLQYALIIALVAIVTLGTLNVLVGHIVGILDSVGRQL